MQGVEILECRPPWGDDMDYRWSVRPEKGVPLYIQLLGNLKWAIASGDLAPGDLLPPMKALVADLGVGLNTLKAVYRALERDGLIMSRRGAGTMVVLPGPVVGAGGGPGGAIRAAVAQVLRGGTPPAEVLKALKETERLLAARAGTGRLAFIECNREQADRLSAQLAAYLDLPVDGLLLAELPARAPTLAEGRHRCLGAVTTYFHFREVREALASTGLPVAAAVVRTSPEAARKLASLGPEEKLGLVCRDRADVGGYTAAVLRLTRGERPVKACSLDDRGRLKELVAWADVLAVTPPCRDQVLRLAQGSPAGERPPGLPQSIVTTHDYLDPADLARLKDFFASAL
ncbi:MAG: GntR family transcriptional regulator [Acetobacteraceae bacterium]|nr:GntR family transcriptional regulator [Acetobacteraceae bacterium]